MPIRCEVKTDFVRLARDYPDQWVALHPQTREVLAAGKNAQAVYERALDLGVDEPVMIYSQADYSNLVLCASG